jgi:hypothetical protein
VVRLGNMGKCTQATHSGSQAGKTQQVPSHSMCQGLRSRYRQATYYCPRRAPRSIQAATSSANRVPARRRKAKGGSQHPLPGGVEAHALAAQQGSLLVQGDALAVARPLALEAAEGAAGGDDAVAGDLGRERVPAQGVADGARRRLELLRHYCVRGHGAGRDLAQ